MTIIAYHDGILMADRRSVIMDDSCHTEIVTEVPKIFKSICKHYVCAVVGLNKTETDMQLMIPLLAKFVQKESSAGILEFEPLVRVDRTGYLFISAKQVPVFTHTEMRLLPANQSVFMGTGGYLAKGYLSSGIKTLKEAMQYVGERDSLCGKTFDRIDCRRLVSKSRKSKS